jgi:hypothetical protein
MIFESQKKAPSIAKQDVVAQTRHVTAVAAGEITFCTTTDEKHSKEQNL